jgi:hypothetical protein
LIGDDQEWYNAFDEAAAWATSPQLRKLFVTMLLFSEVRDEYTFFDKVWRLMSDDIQYQLRDILGDRSYHMSNTDLKDSLLDELATLFSKSGCVTSLTSIFHADVILFPIHQLIG